MPTLADLFGLLACARLAAFERRAADAAQASSHEDTVVLGELAVGAFQQFERLRDHLLQLGVDPPEAMRPFEEAVRVFHEGTRPADAIEALTKVYIADSILADFAMTVAGGIDDRSEALVAESLADSGHLDLVTQRIRSAADNDDRLASRLGLWARRLVGEALSQAHAMIAEHAELAELAGGEEAGALFGRVIDRHHARMRTINVRD